MNYISFSLNGAWEMFYQKDAYISTDVPALYNPAHEPSALVLNAVPGYWEDMTEEFKLMPFFCKLNINPKYGIQQYPILGTAPDMALPNIIGNFFYRRTFVCERIMRDTVIYFEGVQNSVSVWINGHFIGRHEGYSTPFEMEIPDGVFICGENEIVLSVSNHCLEGYSKKPISGLTSRAANEYTGGITGNVELRAYNCPLRDVSLFVSEDCSLVTVKTQSVEDTDFKWVVSDGDNVLKSGEANGDFAFNTSGLECWSPENPKLYDIKMICKDGLFLRKFGIRRLLADGVHFKLNGMPYYLRGICEHCYFPETIHPNHDLAYYRSIIKNIKRLGFNFIRFHTYIPEEEYMQAADELGVLLHVECPNNTTVSEWKEIVKFCQKHTSVVIYCCGNELSINEAFIEYLNECADIVHENTDALFSPMSAMRGLEYGWWNVDEETEKKLLDTPFKHHPERFEKLGKFSDMYSSYANGLLSYFSLDGEAKELDEWSKVYNKPRVSHEICIDGTYTDLSLKDRYKGLRVGKTEMFSSIERHLEEKGVLQKAPLYFKNSSEWQRRMRKHCFETARLSNNLAGYDFLGPIDTHWHTFGYDVGLMNEFYELKPGETERNVLMYNSPTVVLTDLGKKTNFFAGEELSFTVFTSHYGREDLKDAKLIIRIMAGGKVIKRDEITVKQAKNGKVTKLYDFSYLLPQSEKPYAAKLYITLDGNEVFAENEWELYVFPKTENSDKENIVLSNGMDIEELVELLSDGKNVLLLGSTPFESLPTEFRIALAGRTAGNLATVVNDHPVLENMPHEGFCSWQFCDLMQGGSAVCFGTDDVPFNPIIEVVSTHKYVIRQAAMFEFSALNGKLFVCSFDFKDSDPASKWLLSQIVSYVKSDEFKPRDYLDENGLRLLASRKVKKAEENKNFAFNANDKTAVS